MQNISFLANIKLSYFEIFWEICYLCNIIMLSYIERCKREKITSSLYEKYRLFYCRDLTLVPYKAIYILTYSSELIISELALSIRVVSSEAR